MKILIFLCSLIAYFTSISQPKAKPQSYIIVGSAVGMNNKYIYIFYQNNKDIRVTDSALVKEGVFTIKGNISGPTAATMAETSSPNWRANGGDFSPLLFIEPRRMTVVVKTNDFKKLKLYGSKTQSEFYALEKKKKPVHLKMKPYNDNYDSLNAEYSRLKKAKAPETALQTISDKLEVIREAIAPFGKELEKIDKSFFEKNPNSYLTAYQLRYYVAGASYKELNGYYVKMSSELKSSRFGKYIKKEMDELLEGSPGSRATLFSSIDIDGQPLNLAGYKGQYVLLDFWASWCGPCRAGNPHLIELYNKYKKNGIEFIGISDDDRSEEEWKKAIAKDKIGIWKHILRGMKVVNGTPDFTNDTNKGYGIHTLPTKILIDRNGIIIGRYGDGGEKHEELDKKLKQIFGS